MNSWVNNFQWFTTILVKLQTQQDLKEYVLRLEGQARRDNLVIDGIPEEGGETDRDCYNKVVNVLTKMEVPNALDIKIIRCHRLGNLRNSNGRPRPIIFKLHWYGDRSNIWEHRRNLKGSNLYIFTTIVGDVNIDPLSIGRDLTSFIAHHDILGKHTHCP